MILTLLLPWFPILLGVGVGGRLLGRSRGLFLGIVCALFWVVLAQASAGTAIWGNPWTVTSLAAGALAIAAMGCWSGETVGIGPMSTENARSPTYTPDARHRQPLSADQRSEESQGTLRKLTTAMEQFDDWLEKHRGDGDPWPRFDEFLRSVLYECCHATYVRPYRLLSEGEELVSLHEPDPLAGEQRLPARRGIIGHIVTAGRSYLAGNEIQGELLAKLSEDLEDPMAWCFAVKRGTRCLGIVTVGHLAIPPERNRLLLHAVEKLIGQFWSTLWDAVRTRSAIQEDPVSGLPTRRAFLHTAEHSLQDSYRQGEPVAAVVIALEGLRDLSDSGRWEVADEVVREVCAVLRRKVRLDDRLGTFDGSRLILLLRRVDTELASLIAAQLMARVTELCSDHSRWRATVGVRCGLAGSGTGKPDLRTLVARAVAQCRRARLEGIRIANDIGSELVVSGAQT